MGTEKFVGDSTEGNARMESDVGMTIVVHIVPSLDMVPTSAEKLRLNVIMICLTTLTT